MKPTNHVQLLYRLLLRMHPRSFRDRFADEMLWIFKEERQRGRTSRLFLDALLSLVRQHSKVRLDEYPVHAPAGFALLDTGPGIAPRRFVEAGITASFLLAVFMLLLGKTPHPLANICLPASSYRTQHPLQAPSRIKALAKTPPTPNRSFGSEQIDNAAASAVHQLSSSSSATGYCSDK